MMNKIKNLSLVIVTIYVYFNVYDKTEEQILGLFGFMMLGELILYVNKLEGAK